MRFFSTLAVALSLAAAPVMAQEPATGAAGAPRNVTRTGVTKPPGARAEPSAPYSRANTEAQMQKAQRVAAARDKAWDLKTRTTMGSICKGC